MSEMLSNIFKIFIAKQNIFYQHFPKNLWFDLFAVCCARPKLIKTLLTLFKSCLCVHVTFRGHYLSFTLEDNSPSSSQEVLCVPVLCIDIYFILITVHIFYLLKQKSNSHVRVKYSK